MQKCFNAIIVPIGRRGVIKAILIEFGTDNGPFDDFAQTFARWHDFWRIK